MADYTSITQQYNSGAGTDASPIWTGAALAFGGSGGSNEWRFADTGTGATTTTPSASWPATTRPTSGVAAVRELWAFSADAVGLKVTTYDGTRTKANMIRLVFDATGTLASAQRLTAFADNTNPTPSPGTQVGSPTNGANIINGANPDTGTSPILSYLYGNAYGSGKTAAGVQETPAAGSVGTTLTCGTHSAVGSAVPSAGAWLATWQDLQGFVDYITAPAIPQAVSAFNWYIVLCLFMGVNMLPGTMPFCPVVLDYTWT
jgi:hypothetical protein